MVGRKDCLPGDTAQQEGERREVFKHVGKMVYEK